VVLVVGFVFFVLREGRSLHAPDPLTERWVTDGCLPPITVEQSGVHLRVSGEGLRLRGDRTADGVVHLTGTACGNTARLEGTWSTAQLRGTLVAAGCDCVSVSAAPEKTP
jgi:hypothetical protein